MMLLVPADVLRPRRPDEHFADEAAAAREAGHAVAVIDHDALTRGGPAEEAVARVPPASDAVYRGWMLRSEQYEALERALAERDVALRVGHAQYQQAHELPGWCDAVAEQTPESAWTVGDAREDFERACASLGEGPAVLRDYTKSMKHHWDEAAFIPDVRDAEAAWRVASRFRELRDDEFTGGFVVRRFENFVGAEVRTWWVDGRCKLVSAHPDTPDDLPPSDLAVPQAPDLPFVTMDLAQRDDGRWRIVEIGDGQVSDRPRSVSAEEFLLTLF